jgi:hypothetical protein
VRTGRHWSAMIVDIRGHSYPSKGSNYRIAERIFTVADFV